MQKLLLLLLCGLFASTLFAIMLVFSAQNDQITTDEDAAELTALKSNRKLLRFDGDHLKGAAVLGCGEYVAEIAGFLKNGSD